jgi:hypothetical protein
MAPQFDFLCEQRIARRTVLRAFAGEAAWRLRQLFGGNQRLRFCGWHGSSPCSMKGKLRTFHDDRKARKSTAPPRFLNIMRE